MASRMGGLGGGGDCGVFPMRNLSSMPVMIEEVLSVWRASAVWSISRRDKEEAESGLIVLPEVWDEWESGYVSRPNMVEIAGLGPTGQMPTGDIQQGHDPDDKIDAISTTGPSSAQGLGATKLKNRGIT
ncbi:unnamed protein product [Tuber aestivum]|uniref:Uncharacterized protein n=1 Tax=Tuber aestivum TaxID=59557 RepID=A0A292Q2V8_9PEZI|nr:unnamed protein product [Tuber aestivum]